jgi:predicted nucleic acid-binding protein
MNGDKVFVDTNIVVYAYDAGSGEKHKISLKILKDLWYSGLGILSTQVLQEFFIVITGKMLKPLDIKTAKGIINDLLKWDIAVINGESLLGAIEIYQRHKYSFWDSMIIQSAIQGNATLLLSEDLLDGQTIQGVRIKNPFV